MPELSGLQFTGVNLVCQNIEETIGFYRLLGVPIPDDLVWRTPTGPHHVEKVRFDAGASLEMDSPTLARAYNAGQGEGQLVGVMVGFSVSSRESVDALYERMVGAGHTSRQAPWDAFWGARFAIVQDPDGRDVGIMSPSDAEHRQAPPSI